MFQKRPSHFTTTLINRALAWIDASGHAGESQSLEDNIGDRAIESADHPLGAADEPIRVCRPLQPHCFTWSAASGSCIRGCLDQTKQP
jgi:hypothetical protein